jgi:2,4-dienoyl-CoA reductase (NADPH2)
MPISSKFKQLLEPLQVVNVRFRNRIIKPGQILGYADKDGYVGQRNLDFYEKLAKGGVGMIVIEDACVDFPIGGSGDKRISIAEDKFIPSLAELAEVIHKHGCPTFQQIGHVGPAHNQKQSGMQPVAASTLSQEQMSRMYAGRAYNVSRALTIPEIHELEEKFAESAERVKKAGFDGVEIHAGHSYLINSFLSRIWNKREDEYGYQNMENRARFAVQIMRAVRERVGKDYPIGIRINGGEYGLEDGLTPIESKQIAKMLEAAGANYIHVTGYGFNDYFRLILPEQIFYPEPPEPFSEDLDKMDKAAGPMAPLAAAIKSVVSVPVVAVGRMDPILGEQLLRDGKADVIAMGRRLLADPELPNKVAEGRLEDIRPCTACITCSDLFYKGEDVTCRANAALGKEREYEIKPAKKKKVVVVVGGGPSGMEAARVAALRGHEVILYEKDAKLGGLLPLASLIKGVEIENIPALARYLETQITKLGVKIKLGEKFTPALITELRADIIILATGGIPATPDIPGIDKRKVLTSGELHRRVKPFLRFFGPIVLGLLTKFWMPVGKKIIVIGGLLYGYEMAEFLIKRGRQVTIVEPSNQSGVDVLALHKFKLLNWLEKKGAIIIADSKIEEITDRGLVITDKEGKKQTIKADTILTAIPPKPNREFLQEIKAKVAEVYLSGDSKESGLIVDAIADGCRIGITL